MFSLYFHYHYPNNYFLKNVKAILLSVLYFLISIDLYLHHCLGFCFCFISFISVLRTISSKCLQAFSEFKLRLHIPSNNNQISGTRIAMRCFQLREGTFHRVFRSFIFSSSFIFQALIVKLDPSEKSMLFPFFYFKIYLFI